MRIEGDVAAYLAAQTSYTDLTGLTGRVNRKTLKKDTGLRKLEEDGWRSQDLHDILELLDVSSNKFLLLRMLPRMDLFDILYMLDKEQLLFGLMYLPREQLVQMMMHLPKELILKILLYIIPLKDLIKLMPSTELFNILKSKKLDMKELLRAFKEMPEKYLQQIMAKMTGRNNPHLQKAELLAMFQDFPKRKVLEGMKMLPFKALQPLIQTLVERDPELLLELSHAFLFKVMDMMPKATLADAARVLPDDIIIEFLDQLPDFFLAMVAEQIDDTAFSQYLMSGQQNLLYYLASGEQAA